MVLLVSPTQIHFLFFFWAHAFFEKYFVNFSARLGIAFYFLINKFQRAEVFTAFLGVSSLESSGSCSSSDWGSSVEKCTQYGILSYHFFLVRYPVSKRQMLSECFHSSWPPTLIKHSFFPEAWHWELELSNKVADKNQPRTSKWFVPAQWHRRTSHSLISKSVCSHLAEVRSTVHKTHCCLCFGFIENIYFVYWGQIYRPWS